MTLELDITPEVSSWGEGAWTHPDLVPPASDWLVFSERVEGVRASIEPVRPGTMPEGTKEYGLDLRLEYDAVGDCVRVWVSRKAAGEFEWTKPRLKP